MTSRRPMQRVRGLFVAAVLLVPTIAHGQEVPRFDHLLAPATALTVNVIPSPWWTWRTWWAYGPYLLVLATLAAAYRHYHRQALETIRGKAWALV